MPSPLTIPEPAFFLLTDLQIHALQSVTLWVGIKGSACDSSHFSFPEANVFFPVPV
jgi:hypothetical protein